METILGLCIGIGLSAACGFRVFVPLLVMSIASLMGWFEPMQGFEWLSMPSVCIALSIATVFEIGAYYVPWVDNLLDTIATPAALIVGGGTATAVQMSTVAVRGLSTATTGGIANPVVSTGEWISALVISVLSFIVPVLVVIVFIIMLIFVVRWIRIKKKQNVEYEPA